LENRVATLLKGEEWLKDLFDQALDLIQIVDLDGTLIYVNKAWSTLLEYSLDEILGKSLYIFIDEADHHRYSEYRSQIINSTPSNEPIIFSLKSKKGKKISVEGVVTVKVEDGKPLYTNGIFRDVTTRIQNEVQLKRFYDVLKESEHNLQQLLINAPDAIIVIDQESRILFWNPKAEIIFGWRADEVLHQNLSSAIIPVQYREAHERGMKRFLSTGEARVLNKTIEITALHKDGHEFYVSLTISQTSQDAETSFIAFIRDITEQKKNQQELERKTIALEQSNANLEAFAYASSHDLKEPVRKILTFSDRLKERLKEKLEEQDIYFFSRIENAAQRMRSLIDNLLTYSNVNNDTTSLETVDLNEVVNTILEDLELEIQEKEAIITIDLLPVIKGHQRQLQQLFHNLIGNALKYSNDGVAPQIQISYHLASGHEVPSIAKVATQLYHFIQVKDNGIGFNPEDAERIFKIFTRLHGNVGYSGTGVGLSIARKVVENHKGHLWAESKDQEGATFKVLLPHTTF
jgi:PAS domain S-box-containing protein